MLIKKSKKSIRTLTLLFSILFCLSAVSCKDNKKNYNENYKTSVIRVGCAVYDNFVYNSNDKIYRFNRKTEALSNACTNLECDGTCPVDCVITNITGIYDGRLYFYAWQQFTHKIFLAYQDIVTGEIKILKTLEKLEDSGAQFTFVEGNYLYYTSMVLKKGGDALNSDDYERCINRIPKDGGKDEVVIKTETVGNLIMVANGKMIMDYEYKIFTIDIESKEKKEIFDFSDNGYTYSISVPSYLDGKIYIAAYSNMKETSEYGGISFSIPYLIWIDINTGESGRAIETPVISFSLTDNKIYYVPYKLRHLYIPDDYKTNPDNIKYILSDETLYSCDLNGDNNHKLFANETISYVGEYIVVDDVFYGWMVEYSKSTHEYSKIFYGTIDLENGKVTKYS